MTSNDQSLQHLLYNFTLFLRVILDHSSGLSLTFANSEQEVADLENLSFVLEGCAYFVQISDNWKKNYYGWRWSEYVKCTVRGPALFYLKQQIQHNCTTKGRGRTE